jgi:hypothetical protein
MYKNVITEYKASLKKIDNLLNTKVNNEHINMVINFLNLENAYD